ncbi:type VI secretion system baseplate subunit TssF [Paraburkholderia sp. NMBU_R16]|uniref:type VI secretion system baseplate subunit TssF n=1 Tax=Paraburkholderia sp. NMBU_R16 TaxID=2698676 RepID=UPI001566162C|nr:type VI secretion system baseplate subunit TssF [Paraburkholderia sp. NMBU_R16]NRO99300.1 type VI secretion system baseplate subunit TssF [Paraburkholderia sp. NMBU_R16]
MTTSYDDNDDDLLRHHYENELEVLRRGLRAFSQRNPEAAARLSINSDGRSDDPGVERLVQSTALLHARHSAKIDDDYPELSEALIQRTYPQYVRPFPSCAIAQFDIEEAFDSLNESVRIVRGTRLWTRGDRCAFRTAHDVVLAPLRIPRARYALTPVAPASVTLPPDTVGVLSITFSAAKIGGRLDVATPATLRVHLAGRPAMVAALMDTMLLRTAEAYVEDSEGRWTRLAGRPVNMVGFGQQDWLFTDAKEPGQPFGLLGEYFAFAGRFHFVDIDFASLCTAAPGDELTLHLVIAGQPQSAATTQLLAHFSDEHLKLFCTPVVNLFRKEGLSLKPDRNSGAWPIPVQGRNEALTEVWSVDRVCTRQGTPLDSSASLITAHASSSQPRWTLVQRSRPASSDAGRPAALRLVGAGGLLGGEAGIGSLRVDATCTNGDLPGSLSFGAAEGDMRMEGKAPATTKIALLHAPTAVGRLSRTNGALWKLIAQHARHAIQLDRAGLPALKQILQQFAVLSPPQARHIDGITGLRQRLVMTLVARTLQPALVRGLEITLEIDEQLFVANSIAIFAGVMERFFAPYASANNFIQLRILATSGAVLWRGEPVRGVAALL